MADFLADQSSVELAGWLEYERMDDEQQTLRMARAITMAFRVEQRKPIDDDSEEVIDTTAPGFAQQFKGFINEPKVGRPPQRFQSTEILRG